MCVRLLIASVRIARTSYNAFQQTYMLDLCYYTTLSNTIPGVCASVTGVIISSMSSP